MRWHQQALQAFEDERTDRRALRLRSAAWKHPQPSERRPRAVVRPRTRRSASPEPASLRPTLALLGAPRLRLDGAWRELPLVRWVVLLAYLSRCGGWVRREALAALFWPDHDDHAAGQNLRQTLQTIVRSPAGSGLEREPMRVRWTGASDAEAFEASVRAQDWRQAVVAYGGVFLDGFVTGEVAPVQDWIEAERSGLHDRWRTCVLALAGSQLAGERCHEALELGERLLRIDPYDETALRLVLRAAAACGDRQRAEHAYATACDLFARELGVAPEPATSELASALDLVADAT